ncbi:MAG: tRNA lysidine(34) synthetase TilS, partial [Hamadaea sp.]|nr:tRNA lysidine(34) synthetase TilS [Hamadaea sp.]
MAGPAPAVAETRTAVRRALRSTPADSLALVACSGGADSLALAAAAAFAGPRIGRRI